MYRRLLSPVHPRSRRPMTVPENTLSPIYADAFCAVQRNAVVETQLVFLVALWRERAAIHLCTRSQRSALCRSQSSGYGCEVGLYCDQRGSVCLCARLCVSKTAVQISPNFLYILPVTVAWLGPPLTAVWYVIYFNALQHGDRISYCDVTSSYICNAGKARIKGDYL